MAFLGIILLVGLVALSKAASEGWWVEVKNPPLKLPSVMGRQAPGGQELQAFIAALGTAKATPETITAAAQAAAGKGLEATAETLRKKATELRELPAPPIPEANGFGWRRFYKAMAVAAPRFVAPSGHWGAFAFTAKRLQDLGMVKNVRLVPYQGRQVWGLDWVKPPTGQQFLDDPRLQFQAFVRSCQDYRAHYARLRQERPMMFDADGLTLSGWMALCHVAGLSGALRWISSPQDRFPRTTAAVRKANGIF